MPTTAARKLTHRQQLIRETLAKSGMIGVDPRHTEAWMIDWHGELDALTPADWHDAVVDAGAMSRGNPEMSEALADCCGL